MLQALKNIFSVKDIRKKLLFTVFVILLYRFGTFISVPGFNKIMFNEQQIKEANTKDKVFLMANIKLVDAMEEISLEINL